MGKAIDSLTDELVRNYLRLTFTGSRMDRPQMRRIVLAPEYKSLARRTTGRVIALVGAGASLGAGLPSTDVATTKIAKKVSDAGGGDLEEISRRRWEGVDHTEFERMLQAACDRGFRNEVVSELTDLFNVRFNPTYTYELLAHLLKHRFINAIINFNFDEVLDQSIEDELGTDRYHHIVSDGDCRFLPDKKDEEYLAGPIYLKPHGTVGAPPTLRFTLPDYHGVTLPIKGLLTDLVSGDQVTLIVVGFNMQSVEFNDIIDESAHKCTVFNLTLKEHRFPRPQTTWQTEMYERGGHIPVDLSSDLDSRMKELWGRVESRFDARFKPRSDGRHDLICKLVPKAQRPLTDGHPEFPAYLKRRAAVELALATAKASCFLTTRVLVNGRAGSYLRLYRQHGEWMTWRTMKAMCDRMGLRPCTHTREALSFSLEEGQPQPSMTLGAQEFSSLSSALAQNVQSECGDLGQATVADLENVLELMHAKDEVEIVAPRRTRVLELCENPYFFRSLTALKAFTANKIEEGDWDTLLCVAETGQWLNADALADVFKSAGKTLGLVVADGRLLGEIGQKYGPLVKTPAEPMDWWLHNQHMTVFVKNGVASVAVHFERRMRNVRVAPVLVDGEDADYLEKQFFAYWAKAEKQGRIDAGDIDRARNAFYEEEISVDKEVVEEIIKKRSTHRTRGGAY